MRTAASNTARRLADIYVDIFRNVPFIVQLFFLFYGLPEIGIVLSALSTGVLALSLAGGAFASDAIRAGVLAIEPGVLEAALVSGLSRLTLYRRIVLPIALRSAVRPLGSVFVNLILTSSILSAITLNEATGSAKIVAADTFQPFEVYALLLVLYATLTWLVSLSAGALHRRLNRGQA
ncbi:MAG: amino acid ABC transporter permease, partial [Telluria sp.]